jgi:hypothetical protein
MLDVLIRGVWALVLDMGQATSWDDPRWRAADFGLGRLLDDLSHLAQEADFPYPMSLRQAASQGRSMP